MRGYRVPRILNDDPNFVSAMRSGDEELVTKIINERLKSLDDSLHTLKQQVKYEENIMNDLGYFLGKYRDKETRDALHSLYGNTDYIVEKGKNRILAMRGMPSIYSDVTSYVDHLTARIEQLEHEVKSLGHEDY